LYAGLTLDYRLRLWAPIFASRAVSAVAELLVVKRHSANVLAAQSQVCESIMFCRRCWC